MKKLLIGLLFASSIFAACPCPDRDGDGECDHDCGCEIVKVVNKHIHWNTLGCHDDEVLVNILGVNPPRVECAELHVDCDCEPVCPCDK